MGIATVNAAMADHGLQPQFNGRAIEIVLWTDDTDRAFADLAAAGSRVLSPPHDFLDDLRVAWVTDPDDNPINSSNAAPSPLLSRFVPRLGVLGVLAVQSVLHCALCALCGSISLVH